MITWPTWFPAPDSSLAGTVQAPVARTKMDSGRTRQRPLVTGVNTLVDVRWELSDDEFGVFLSVFQNALSNGADWFLMPLTLGDATQTYTVRFVGGTLKHTFVPHLHWAVTASLETENQVAPFNSEEVELLLESSLEDIEAAVDSLHILVHETLPN